MKRPTSFSPLAFLASTRLLIIALVACSLVALMSIAGIAAAGIRHLAATEDAEVQQGIAQIGGAHVLKGAAVQQVLAVRDYVITGNRGDLERAGLYTRQYAEALDVIAERGGERPLDVLLVSEVVRLARDFEALRLRVVARRERGDVETARLLFNRQGQDLVERWVNRLDALILRQEQNLAEAHASVNQAETVIFHAAIGVSVVGIPLTLFLGMLVLRRVVRPLRELETASQAIAGGQLSVRVSPRYPDEFGELGVAFNRMAEEVEQTLVSLREANTELQTADRYKDEFLSIVSHELRTPLSFIQGFADVLDRELAGPLAPEQRAYVGNIRAGAERMALLVNDLLDLAAIQAGKLGLNCSPQPFAPLVEEVLATLQPLAEEKQLSLRAESLPDCVVSLDRTRIVQVLTNLVGNAIKFTPEGGQVTVSAEVEQGTLLTRVKDTGIGIEAAALPKLFTRFARVDTSATRSTGGTGLGLSISKALVEAHGGTIGVTSEVGRGSTFWFRLGL